MSGELCKESSSGVEWNAVIRSDDEHSFSRRCLDEWHARFVAEGLGQDHIKAGWTTG
jgi:hypothetical protein